MPGSHAERFAGYRAVSTALALLGDRQLATLVDDAPTLGSTIGGTTVRLEIAGRPVFAKRVPLTDLEREPDRVMSTANHFALPGFYQYRVGSAGFGVWRELATHALTTTWVLGKDCESFPLMYHWRVLPSPARPRTPEERAELERMVAYWEGSPAVRARLEAIACASASVVIFLEHIPHTVHGWLTARGEGEVAEACAWVEQASQRVVAFMRAHELLHLDAHFHNILTDGERLYFADFGLAMARRFELSEAELAFFARHAGYDAYVTATELVNWLAHAFAGKQMPAFAAAILERHAPVAATTNAFFRRLLTETRTAEFPADSI